MKVMFISDIHGIPNNLGYIRDKFEELGCEKLVVLGDLYYYGPKKHLDSNYNVEGVNKFLNSFKDKIICIKGNCDSEIDIEISEFPIVDKLGLLSIDGTDMYLTHGHIYNENSWNKENSILIYGHFHTPFIRSNNSNIFISPGSISLPKNESKPSFLIYDNKTFTLYDIYNNKIDEKHI